KDAQRHGLKVLPVDVTRSNWECALEDSEQWAVVSGQTNDAEMRRHGDTEREIPTTDHRPPTTDHCLRVGLLCVRGLREAVGRAIVRARNERLFTSLDDLHHRVPELRKDELRKLAAVGALNHIEGVGDRVLGLEDASKSKAIDSPDHENLSAFAPSRETSHYIANPPATDDEISRKAAKPQRIAKTSTKGSQLNPIPSPLIPAIHRRDALWQVERVSRDPGPLYEPLEGTGASPLDPMSLNERLNADLRGTGITIGRHPMAHQREWLNTMKVTPAGELRKRRNGTWVKVAGWVIV